MQYVKAREENAEKLKRKLIRAMLYDKQRSVKHSPSYVYFPIISISRNRIKKLLDAAGASVVDEKEDIAPRKRPDYREMLRAALTKRQFEEITKSYDLLGNIAVLDSTKNLGGKEKVIARAIMLIHPAVRTVISKAGAVSGTYRTRKFKHISGEKNFIATYKENHCTFSFDVRKAFFSNRLSFERSRIASLVKDREKVAVLFAGVGPFAIEIAKQNPKASVIAIELNPYACRSMKENVKINKTHNVRIINQDVRKAAGRHRDFADRIVVPMPTTSTAFFDEIAKMAKKSATVHLYAFAGADAAFREVAEKIKEHAKNNSYSVEVLSQRIARPYSAMDAEIVVDYRMKKK